MMTCDPLCSPTPLARILVLRVRWPNMMTTPWHGSW
jgi:hypothetical protein